MTGARVATACRVGYLVALLIALGASSASSQGATRAAGDTSPSTHLFQSTPQRDLSLDVYRPPDAKGEATPAVVYIFGGAWMGGDRKQVVASLALRLLEEGYTVIAIDYRLSHEALFPAQIHDVKAAVCWIRSHSADLGIDPARIGAWGPSAGGHLAALVGTSSDVTDLATETCDDVPQRARVQAVVDEFGPTDFLQMDAHSPNGRLNHDAAGSPESRLVGGPIQKYPERVARANPITYVTPDDPPVLILHGDEDPLVPFHQSQILHEALERAGVPSELHRVEGGGHGTGGTFGTDAHFERILRFLDATLAPEAESP